MHHWQIGTLSKMCSCMQPSVAWTAASDPQIRVGSCRKALQYAPARGSCLGA